MKNTFFIAAAALFLGTAAQAQSTADSIAAKYQLQPMPAPLTVEKTFPVVGTYQLTAPAGTADAAAPGTYPDPQHVVISLDSSNKGMVWIDGLPQGRMKAYLRQSPATYRIVAQKGEDGRQIPEGTLIFDPGTNMLNIALGKAYDDAQPSSIFDINTTSADATAPATVKVKSRTAAGTKEKSKIYFYTAAKTEEAMSTSTNAAKQ